MIEVIFISSSHMSQKLPVGVYYHFCQSFVPFFLFLFLHPIHGTFDLLTLSTACQGLLEHFHFELGFAMHVYPP